MSVVGVVRHFLVEIQRLRSGCFRETSKGDPKGKFFVPLLFHRRLPVREGQVSLDKDGVLAQLQSQD